MCKFRLVLSNMDTKNKVYEAFAELIYSVVMADGEIKEPEKTTITTIAGSHPIAQNIQRYLASNSKDTSIAQSFLHTIDVCKEHGNDPEYPFLLNMIVEISKVSEGIENDDEGLFGEFVNNFKKRFSLN